MQKGVDHIGVSVVFYCHDGEGNFVMSKRNQERRDERGCWDPGGGALDLHENVEETLKREVMEEYGVEPLEFEFLGYRDVHRENGDDKTHWVSLDFKVLVDREKVINNEPHKHDEVGWFTLDDLPSPLHSQMNYFVEKYRGRLV
ncbi:NUDIX domain-containing protein [Candidatus Nomurabacteria bacterium]|nr:NUDIX domain-containing protein [Candidatus Nomurabacteria bacterium]